MKMTNINIRTDIEVKEEAQKIFNNLGLDMTTAINIFLRQTIRQNDLPFVLTTNHAFRHGETLKENNVKMTEQTLDSNDIKIITKDL